MFQSALHGSVDNGYSYTSSISYIACVIPSHHNECYEQFYVFTVSLIVQGVISHILLEGLMLLSGLLYFKNLLTYMLNC